MEWVISKLFQQVDFLSSKKFAFTDLVAFTSELNIDSNVLCIKSVIRVTSVDQQKCHTYLNILKQTCGQKLQIVQWKPDVKELLNPA